MKISFSAIHICLQFSFLLILTSYTKSGLNSLRNNKITMKLLITDICSCRDKGKSEMTSYLNNGYDVTNYSLNLKNSYLIGKSYQVL